MFYSYSVTVLGMLLSGAAAAPGAPWIFPEFAKWSTPEPAPGSSTLINAIRDSSVKAGPVLPLTKEKVELMALAAELTQAVYYQGNTNCDADNDREGPDCDPFNPGYEALGYNALYSAEIASNEMTVLISDDNVDANLFMDIGDYCFVTWRATISFDFTDITTVKDWFYRNFDTDDRDVAPIGETTTCSVHEGIYEAYQGGEGTNADLEDDIIRFVEGCMDGKPNKQLVLTGHSQGAGAAMMGALRFADRNPLTIALAGAPILQSGEECPVINRDHIWRVVNTENNEDNTELMYDLVPYAGLFESCWLGWVSNKVGTHIGASIHLPPDSPIQQPDGYSMPSSPLNPQQSKVAYWGPNDGEEEENYGPESSNLSGGNDVGSSVHWVETGYLPKLVALLEGPFPITAQGYVEGTLCTGDSECEHNCINNKCTGGSHLLALGDECTDDDDCESGSCSYWREVCVNPWLKYVAWSPAL